MSWFRNVSTYSGKVIEYSVKFYLNQNQNYKGIWTQSWYCWKAISEQDLKNVI